MSDLIERLRRRAGLSPAALDALLTEAAGRHERDAAALDKLATDYLRLETQAQEALYEVAALRRKVADLSRTLADHAARLSEAERERDDALHPRPEPHARGGFTARLPWRPDGYPRGHRVWDVARPGDCFYHFDRLDDAEAALQGARDAATGAPGASDVSGDVAGPNVRPGASGVPSRASRVEGGAP